MGEIRDLSGAPILRQARGETGRMKKPQQAAAFERVPSRYRISIGSVSDQYRISTGPDYSMAATAARSSSSSFKVMAILPLEYSSISKPLIRE